MDYAGMDNDDLVLIANSKLGWAVGEQLDAVLSGDALEDQNPNALRQIEKFLRRYAQKYNEKEWEDTANTIKEYLAK